MRIEKYHLRSESDFTTFEFISEGPNRLINKIIEFQATTNFDVYNLAFGDKDPITKEMNDLSISNNKDTEKVLATVVDALYTFFDKHTTAFVYASGSTSSRTRLYTIGITKFYEQMKQDFYLYGQVGEDFTQFEIGRDYDGFLVQRKFT